MTFHRLYPVWFLASILVCRITLPAAATLAQADLSSYHQLRYVSITSGSDTTSNGTQSAPWKTLNYALSQVTVASSTQVYALLISSGTYTSTGTTPFTMVPYVHLFGGYNPTEWTRESASGETILDGENTRRVVTMASNCTLDGLVITHGYATPGAGIYCYEVSSANITNCTIINNTASNNGGGIYWSQSTLNISRCVFAWNTSFEDGGGLNGSSTNTVNITNCVIHHNRASNFGAGIHCKGGASPKLLACTIVDNFGCGLSCEGSCSPKFYNCILWNRGSELVGGTPMVLYCNVQGGLTGTGNINVQPNFVDPGQGNYHLRDGSPCINRGNRNYGPSTDLDGNTRPQGTNSDMGAYEEPATYTQGTISAVTPTQRYVRFDAPEGGDGLTWSTAHQTIGAALDVANMDDDIWVSGGTYHEAIILEPSMSLYGGFAGTETSLSQRDLGAHSTIIDATGLNKSTVIGADKARLNGFTLTKGRSTYGGGLNCCGVSPRIENCILSNNSTSHLGGAIYCEYASPSLTNCVISKNTSDIYSGVVIVSLYGSPGFNHCTIVGNTSGQGNALRFRYTSTPNLTNCIVWNPGTEILADGAELTVSYSCVQGGWEGTGNISAPPRFQNASGGDYHLLDGSPCIGRATSTVDLSTDIVSNPRILGSAPDMGAYEAPSAYIQGSLEYDTSRYYVRRNAPDGGDGSSWAKAFNSINAALSTTWPGDEVCVASGTYNEGVVLESGVSLYGGFAGTEASLSERNWMTNTTIINAAGLSRQAVFGAEGAFLDGVTMTGGTISGVYSPSASLKLVNCAVTGNSYPTLNGGGGITIDNATLELDGCTITNNNSSIVAGGIYCMNCSAVITNCSITHNTGRGSGGGLYCYNTVVSITGCFFMNNQSGTSSGGTGSIDTGYGGGAIHARYSTISLSGCSLSDNYTSSDGGGFVGYKSTVNIIDCTADSNYAKYGSGGGFFFEESSGAVANCLIQGNTVDHSFYDPEGGLCCVSSTFQIQGCTITGCGTTGFSSTKSSIVFTDNLLIGNSGKGIYCSESPGPTITGCTISDTEGVGIYCDNSPATIANCLIMNNNNYKYGNYTYGGGVYLSGVNSATLTHNTISGNYSGYGGGIYISDSSPNIQSCQICDNSAYQKGGGICCESSSAPIFTNCLILSNMARSGGGFFGKSPATPSIFNSTFSGNRPFDGSGEGSAIYLENANPTLRNCIIWNNLRYEFYRMPTSGNAVQYCDVMGGFIGTGNIDEDPLFANPARWNFHLQEGSPCIGTGTGPDLNPLVPLFDLDGNPRTGETCDMGAYEFPDPTAIQEWMNY